MHSSTEGTNHESTILRGYRHSVHRVSRTRYCSSKDLDENTVLDLDADGNVCAITFEHASDRTDVHRLTVEGIAA